MIVVGDLLNEFLTNIEEGREVSSDERDSFLKEKGNLRVKDRISSHQLGPPAHKINSSQSQISRRQGKRVGVHRGDVEDLKGSPEALIVNLIRLFEGQISLNEALSY